MGLFSSHRSRPAASYGRAGPGAGPPDFLVVGLGNPGPSYETTRHNIGFLTLDALSERWRLPVSKLKFQALYGQGQACGRKVVLLRPQTFMNLSGEAVRACAQFFKIPPEHILVIYDDVSLPTGHLRLRATGSDGGHNGIKNILYHLKTDRFPRVKIGVGSPPNPDFDLADFVLAPFSASEQPLMRDAIARACEAVECILTQGMDTAMNRFNTRPVPKEKPKPPNKPEGGELE